MATRGGSLADNTFLLLSEAVKVTRRKLGPGPVGGGCRGTERNTRGCPLLGSGGSLSGKRQSLFLEGTPLYPRAAWFSLEKVGGQDG